MPKTIHRPEYSRLRKQIRAYRLAAGYTQLELSDALGKTQSYVSDIELGKSRVDVIQLADICSILGVSLSEFVREYELSQRKSTRGKAREG
jgi:transcriptional regulator with XRE-family HTH domain